MAKRTPDQSTGLVLALLLFLVIIAAIVSAFFYTRLWGSQNTSRPITSVKPMPVTTNTTPVSEVSVATPLANSQVTSPITIAGSAPGAWYFEASFPVRLEDLQGTVLAQSYAQAEGEWMTEEQVPFTSTVVYSVTSETDAMLVFQPDDPAGLGVTEEYRHPIHLLP